MARSSGDPGSGRTGAGPSEGDLPGHAGRQPLGDTDVHVVRDTDRTVPHSIHPVPTHDPSECTCAAVCPDDDHCACAYIYADERDPDDHCECICPASASVSASFSGLEVKSALDRRVDLNVRGASLADVSGLLARIVDAEIFVPAHRLDERQELYLKDVALDTVVRELGLIAVVRP